ncbi:glycosyltransferase family 2 protein [Candidatus Woesebacteria bacterium]|nr:glycosyltransferase family 2 protein [Candidatus Woesebacteria bacterium]
MKRVAAARVYIGIVTYNSAELISICIDAIFRQSYEPITVVIMDNDSTDNIERIVKRYGKKVTFIRSAQNLGFGGGHNKIIRSMRLRGDDYYLALNPDAILDPDSIKKLVYGARKHNADWATGKLYKDSRTHTLYSVGHALRRDGYAFNIGHDVRDNGQYNKSREVFGAAGAAALYKGSMVQSVSNSGNFFDPSIFMYYEDVDVDWRARLLGLRCWFIAGAVVYHRGGSFPAHLEAGVLVNRFLSVIKNAFWMDLVFYNGPSIFIHIITRFILTPKVGMQIVSQFYRKAWDGLFHRSKSRASRRDLLVWFARASQEGSGMPMTIVQRASAFFHRNF